MVILDVGGSSDDEIKAVIYDKIINVKIRKNTDPDKEYNDHGRDDYHGNDGRDFSDDEQEKCKAALMIQRKIIIEIH